MSTSRFLGYIVWILFIISRILLSRIVEVARSLFFSLSSILCPLNVRKYLVWFEFLLHDSKYESTKIQTISLYEQGDLIIFLLLFSINIYIFLEGGEVIKDFLLWFVL